MHFVSFVGTQVMAILNPLLSVIRSNHCRNLEQITLLTTSYRKTSENAEKIRDFLTRKNKFPYRDQQFEIIEVPSSDKMTDGNHLSGELQKIFGSKPICFNLAGGQSYHVSQIISRLVADHDFLVYPASSETKLFRLTGNKTVISKLDPPEELEIPELLDMQGIKYQITERSMPDFLKDIFKDVKNPPSVIAEGVEIDGIYFDVVWNRNNGLTALKYVDNIEGEPIDFARSIMTPVKSRLAFSELYHRKIGIVTSIKTVAQRLREEAGSKIDIFFLSNNPYGRKKILKKIHDYISQHKSARPSNWPKTKKIQVRSSTPSNDSRTLHIVLPPNTAPALLALWSHRPSRAVCYYTPGNLVVEKRLKAFKDYKDRLPQELETVELRPVSIDGVEILDHEPSKGNFEVNITPGGKSHSAFLSILANLNGMPDYSIETSSQMITCINGKGKDIKLQGPTPADFLRFSGTKIQSLGKTQDDLKIMDQNHILWDFFRAMVREGFALEKFPKESCKFGEWSYTGEKRGNTCHIKRRGQFVLNLSVRGGEWFEEFVGYALIMAGADDVQVRIRTKWPREKQASLEKSFGENTFLSDMDVTARFKGNYFLVSCKACPLDCHDDYQETLHKTVTDAEANASLFGTFCVPLVCGLHEKNDIRSESGVPVFGLETLVDPDKLYKLLHERVGELRKK